MNEHQPPLCLALVVADIMTVDLGTGKFSLVGIYHSIVATSFPSEPQSIMIYVALTDGRPGKTTLVFRLVSAEDDEAGPLFEAPMEVEFQSPFEIVDFVLPAPPVQFPKAGEYCLELQCGGVSLMDRRIVVAHVP